MEKSGQRRVHKQETMSLSSENGWQAEFQKAMHAWCVEESPRTALPILNEVMNTISNEIGPLIVRGTVLHELGKFEEALLDFQAARHLNPAKGSNPEELISNGIFHCLIALGYFDQAITEAQSYLASDSMQDRNSYQEALEELLENRRRFSDKSIYNVIESNREH